jgi:hypothetical protein
LRRWYIGFADLKYKVSAIIAIDVEFSVTRGLSVVGEVGHLLLQEETKLDPGDIAIVIGIGVRFLAGKRVKEELAQCTIVRDLVFGFPEDMNSRTGRVVATVIEGGGAERATLKTPPEKQESKIADTRRALASRMYSPKRRSEMAFKRNSASTFGNGASVGTRYASPPIVSPCPANQSKSRAFSGKSAGRLKRLAARR